MRTPQEAQLALIEERIASGETIRSFCERKGISVDSFKRWQKVKRRRQLGATAGDFLPVVIKTPDGDQAACRIMVGNLVSIECSSTTAPAALELALLAAVRVCGRT